MSSFLQSIKDLIFIDDGQSSFIKKGLSGSIILEALAKVLVLGTTLLLTNYLTADDYGRYSYYMGWIISIATIGTLGLDDLVIKQMGHQDFGLQNRYNRSALFWSGLAVVGLATLFYYIEQEVAGIGYIVLTVILLTRQYLLSALMKGRKHILSAQLPEQFLRPAAFLILVLIWFFVIEDRSFEAICRILFYTSLFSVGCGYLLLYRKEGISAFRSGRIKTDIFSKELFFFGALSFFGVFRHKLDVIFLGFADFIVEAGVYNICSKLSDLILVGLVLTNAIYMPLFADQKNSFSVEKLGQLLKSSALVNLIFGGILLLIFLFFGTWILGFFGSEFTAGYEALIVLSIAAFIYAILGPYIVMLMMVGHAREVLIGLVIGVGVQLFSAIALVPNQPILGMAISKGMALIVTQIWMVYVAWKYLRLPPVFLISK